MQQQAVTVAFELTPSSEVTEGNSIIASLDSALVVELQPQ